MRIPCPRNPHTTNWSSVSGSWKRSERAIREREERLRTLLLVNFDPMVMYDFDGVPRYLNPAFPDVFGWTLDELKGQRIPFVPEDQKALTAEQIRIVYASCGSVT